MGNSTKRKKAKAADFAKAKLKLGKGKQVANNATDTSFKSRSVALPMQSIMTEKDSSEPVTKRHLSFDELLVHIKHYSPGTRKDALLGLRELLSAHPELIQPSLHSLLYACARLISDEDSSVRKTLISFLSWLIPLVSMSDFAPHASFLILFTTSALSHIFIEIRIDALQILDLLLEAIPDVVTSGWDSGSVNGSNADWEKEAGTSSGSSGHGRRVLDGYLALFNLKGRQGEIAIASSSSSVVLSAASKLILLKSFNTFLKSSLQSRSSGSSQPTSTSTPTWFFQSAFPSQHAYENFIRLLKPSVPPINVVWRPEVDLYSLDEGKDGGETFVEAFELADVEMKGLGGWSLDDLGSAEEMLASLGRNSRRDDESPKAEMELVRLIHPLLLSTFLDAAPSVFNHDASSGLNLELVCIVGSIARELYGTVLRDRSNAAGDVYENLQRLLTHMAPYFPFGEGSFIKRDPKSEQLLQEFSLAYCELTSLQVSFSHSSSKTSPALGIQRRKVGEYVIRALRGEIITASHPMGSPLPASSYTALLPTIWFLINQTNGNGESKVVMEALLDHSVKIGSGSASKKISIEFVGRLVLLQSERLKEGAFRFGDLHAEGGFREWLLSLPRTLWELGGGNLPGTEVILRLFLRLLQRRFAFLDGSTISQLRQRLVPYFLVEHPTKGTLLGPFTKLPSNLKRLTLDVILSFPREETSELDGAVKRALELSGSGEESRYWRDVRR